MYRNNENEFNYDKNKKTKRYNLKKKIKNTKYYNLYE